MGICAALAFTAASVSLVFIVSPKEHSPLQPHLIPYCTSQLNPRWLGMSFDPDKCGQFFNEYCIAICVVTALTAGAIDLCTYRAMRKFNATLSALTKDA